jgi:hypothetical protein
MSSQSFLDEPCDLNAEPGSKPWARAVARAIRFQAKTLDTDVESLQEWIAIAAEHSAWKVLGYISLDSFLVAEANFTQSIIDAIRDAKPGTKLEEVIDMAKDNPLPPANQEDAPRNPNGVNQYNKEDRSGRDSTRPSDRSNTYTLRRLARDNPELLDKIEAGELSVNQAAIQAGIRKRPTALDQLRATWRKATEDEREAFLREIEAASLCSERR